MNNTDRSTKARGNRPALKLINMRELNRDEWLTLHKGGIGSSDAGTAVGLNPYQSQLELWMIKTGRDAGLNKVNPNDETRPEYWENLLDPIVAAHYTRRTGNRVRKINTVLQHPDTDKAWMLANIEREVVDARDVQILACKTAGEFDARHWRDGVPDYIVCEIQHQLAVTGKAAADVCVLVCGEEIRVYRISRDDALIARLIELERQFWYYVESDTTPPPDGSDSSEAALRILYPNDSGNTIDLTQDVEMSAIFSDLVNLRANIANREELESLLEQRIEQRMGDASHANFKTGSVSFKRCKNGSGLDVPALLLDKPDLLKQYPLTEYRDRRFLIIN